MIWKIAKWTAPLLVTVVAAAALFTKKTFHVETTISAPPDAVWAVLMDTSKYREWNPVFVGVEGAYAEGRTVTNTVRFPNGSDVRMEAAVKRLTTSRELRQTGGVPGLLTFDHQWLLEAVPGGARVIQHEVDRGLWLWFWDSSWIEPAYAEVLTALKERVEPR